MCLTAAALAQSATPPRLLEIHRDRLRPGAAAQYRDVEGRAAQICRDAPCPNPHLAMQSATGAAEVWRLSGFESWEGLERVWSADWPGDLERIEQEKAGLVYDPLTVLARYREDLSHDAGVPLTLARYMAVETVYVRPGFTSDFEAARRLSRGVYARANAPVSRLVYEAISGVGRGTFFVLTPMRALSEWERTRGSGSVDPAVRAKTQELARESVSGSETALFQMSPAMSFVTKEWAASDPRFWESRIR